MVHALVDLLTFECQPCFLKERNLILFAITAAVVVPCCNPKMYSNTSIICSANYIFNLVL